MKHLLLLITLLSFNAFAELATLQGEPPSQREDNSAFNLDTELDGFKVYCGTVSGNYTDSYTFTGYTLPVTEWIVDLPLGVNYCAITTIDNDGRESVYSNEVTVTLDGKYRPKAPTVVETIINIVITLPITVSPIN